MAWFQILLDYNVKIGYLWQICCAHISTISLSCSINCHTSSYIFLTLSRMKTGSNLKKFQIWMAWPESLERFGLTAQEHHLLCTQSEYLNHFYFLIKNFKYRAISLYNTLKYSGWQTWKDFRALKVEFTFMPLLCSEIFCKWLNSSVNPAMLCNLKLSPAIQYSPPLTVSSPTPPFSSKSFKSSYI